MKIAKACGNALRSADLSRKKLEKPSEPCVDCRRRGHEPHLFQSTAHLPTVPVSNESLKVSLRTENFYENPPRPRALFKQPVPFGAIIPFGSLSFGLLQLAHRKRTRRFHDPAINLQRVCNMIDRIFSSTTLQRERRPAMSDMRS